MINKLTLEQVSQFWDIVKYGLERSLPPDVVGYDKTMSWVLAAALSGKVDVWASYTKHQGKITLNGIVVTKLVYDDTSDTKNLLIYSLYGYSQIPKESWKEALVCIAEYANSLGCLSVLAYSTNPQVIKMAEALGADINSYLSFNVDKFVKKLNELEV